MSYAAATLNTLKDLLGTLTHLLARAEESGKPDLLSARLAEDMFPLATQIRIATFQAFNTLNKLAGTEFAPAAGDPATYAEAHALIARAAEAVASVDAGQFLAADAPVEFDLPNGMAFAMTAEQYAREWSIAQTYFHVVTFYAILRGEGVPLGKVDFMTSLTRHLKTPATAA